MGAFVNLDSAETIFFERELEARKSNSYDVVRAPLRAFELIPVSTDAGIAAETISYEQYDETGIARIIANYAEDLPRADVKGKLFVSQVRGIGNSYGYSLQEVRAAMMAGKPLEQRKANAAVRAHRELWNRIAFYGDASHNLVGWLDNPNIPSAAAPGDGAGASTLWADKTAEQILRDMHQCANIVVERSNGAEQPNTLLLPMNRYHVITTKRFGEGSDTTIAQHFLANNPYISSIEWSNEITNANRDANMATDPFTGEIMIAYRRDPDAFTLEMPLMFEQLPTQERGLQYLVPCHSRIGGVIIYYPFSQNVMENI